VADILLFLAEGQGTQSGSRIDIPNLPHRELSSLSGMARETVTRVLGKLERKGLIQRTPESFSIVDVDALEDLLV
jgi:DNA-binding MarR family transcriptional regulator